MSRSSIYPLALICLFYCADTLSHHAFVEFNRDTTIEVEGVLSELLWRNPHIRFELKTVNDAGEEESWQIEGSSTSVLSRLGIGPEQFREGTQIRVAGWPVWSGDNRLHVNNALISGQEYVLGSRATPRWSEDAVGTDHVLMASGSVSEDNSIFRVWSTDGDDPHSNTPGFWNSDYPLTQSAIRARDEWIPVKGSQCEPKGMPTIMEQPYPIGFSQEGDDIILRLEEYDTVRTISMGTTPTNGDEEKTLLGTSVGHWEGDTLVVSTDAIDWAYFDKEGIPQGEAMTVMERFTPSADGSRLEYEMRVTDFEVFTQPVHLERHWVWRAGEEVKPYDCI